MKKIRCYFLLICTLLLSLMVQAEEQRIVQQWESSTGELQGPESVVYDAKRKVLYVSNVNGKPLEKVENGFISRVSAEDGKILELKWFADQLWAPKGMAIADDHLFVADISKVVEVDLETASLVNTYPVVDAVFLNDVAADADGYVYISDMKTDKIHRLKDGEIQTWVSTQKLASPNGLTVVNDQLVVGTWGMMDGEGFETSTPGHLLSISLCKGEIVDVGSAEPVGNLDGVEQTRQGNFLVTDWMVGKLFLITDQGEVETLLELTQGSADIEYIQETGLLLIPMMLDNKLLAYKFSE